MIPFAGLLAVAVLSGISAVHPSIWFRETLYLALCLGIWFGLHGIAGRHSRLLGTWLVAVLSLHAMLGIVQFCFQWPFNAAGVRLRPGRTMSSCSSRPLD